MLVFIGVDLSINSSGVYIGCYQQDMQLISQHFYIIKPDKLTKKEKEAQERHKDIFTYVLYEKNDLSKYKDDYHSTEYYKTINMLTILRIMSNLLSEYIDDEQNTVCVCQEGISYGSSKRTKSVFDLAGLNYLLRSVFVGDDSVLQFTIASPSEIKKYATGKGNANKDMIMKVFDMLFENFDLPKKDDIADAYFMGSYAKHLYETKKGRT